MMSQGALVPVGFQGAGASVHDSLAVRVCNEILRDPSAPEVRLYCKTLGTLEISADPGPANNELQQLFTSVLQVTHTLHASVVKCTGQQHTHTHVTAETSLTNTISFQ